MKKIDPDLQIIFEEMSTNIIFLNINTKLINN